MISHVVRELILPPGSLLMLLAASFALRHRKPRWAAALFLVAFSLLFVLATPLVSFWLTRTTETRPALTLQEVRDYQPQAIVLLGAGVDFDAPEYEGRSVPSAAALKRIAHAAYLAKLLEVPIITTGGYGDTPEDAEGQAAAWHLQQSGFGNNILVEAESHNTAENAYARSSASMCRRGPSL